MEQNKPQLEEKGTGPSEPQSNEDEMWDWPQPRLYEKWYGPQSYTYWPLPQKSDEQKSWPQPWKGQYWPQPKNVWWDQWSQPYDETFPADDKWPQPKQMWWNQWSQPYDESFPSQDNNKYSAAAACWPWPKKSTASSSTETTPADLLEAKQQDQYWSDVMFLEKNEQKDRKRRQAYRANLRERKWEAAERIAMVEADVDANSSLKKRKLSTQVIEIARKNEATAVMTLSDTLPGTPVELKHHQQISDDEKPGVTDRREPQKSHVDEACSKKHKTESAGQQQMLHLTPWLLQRYQLNQPTDVNLPQGLIERKDAKYRWASYSRIAPQLHSHTRSPQGQIAPPFGIQLIDSFRKWQALQIPCK